MNNIYNPFFRYRYPCYSYYPCNMHQKTAKKNHNNTTHIKNKEAEATAEPKQNQNICSDTTKFSNQALLEFYGIKLFSDDLLILLLIYFLYKQDTKDTLLYILLFTLLFS